MTPGLFDSPPTVILFMVRCEHMLLFVCLFWGKGVVQMYEIRGLKAVCNLEVLNQCSLFGKVNGIVWLPPQK